MQQAGLQGSRVSTARSSAIMLHRSRQGHAHSGRHRVALDLYRIVRGIIDEEPGNHLVHLRAVKPSKVAKAAATEIAAKAAAAKIAEVSIAGTAPILHHRRLLHHIRRHGVSQKDAAQQPSPSTQHAGTGGAEAGAAGRGGVDSGRAVLVACREGTKCREDKSEGWRQWKDSMAGGQGLEQGAAVRGFPSRCGSGGAEPPAAGCAAICVTGHPQRCMTACCDTSAPGGGAG